MNNYDNSQDADNLAFLLLSTDQDLADWRASCTEDDVEYALELLQDAYTRILTMTSPYYNTPGGFDSARDVLARFRL